MSNEYNEQRRDNRWLSLYIKLKNANHTDENAALLADDMIDTLEKEEE